VTSHVRTGAALLTAALAAPLAGCWGSSDVNPFARQPAPPGPVVATPIDADAVAISEPSPWIVRYRVSLPAVCAPLAGGTLKLGFTARLDGAKVDAFVEGPRQRVAVLHGKRVGGDSVAVPLAPGTLDTVDIWVHRRLRSPPIVRDAVIERFQVRAEAAERPPLAASGR
jgi:hypothetical protein